MHRDGKEEAGGLVVWLVLALFVLILGGALAAFAALELVAIRRDDDEIYPLTWYIRRARRWLGITGTVLIVAFVAGLAVVLILHLAFDVV